MLKNPIAIMFLFSSFICTSFWHVLVVTLFRTSHLRMVGLHCSMYVFILNICNRKIYLIGIVFSPHSWENSEYSQIFIYSFLERGVEKEKEREKHQCVVASYSTPTGDRAHNPGMCPDWESNWWPFGSQPVLNPLSYTSQGSLWTF